MPYNEAMPTEKTQKVTVILPVELIRKATRASKSGLTPTIRQGLESLVTANAYRQLRQVRGTQKFTINLKRLRRD
jgi:hypothetical protein